VVTIDSQVWSVAWLKPLLVLPLGKVVLAREHWLLARLKVPGASLRTSEWTAGTSSFPNPIS
jgi:hypothetical protein